MAMRKVKVTTLLIDAQITSALPELNAPKIISTRSSKLSKRILTYLAESGVFRKPRALARGVSLVVVLVGLFTSVIYASSPITAAQQKEAFMEKKDAKRQEIYNDLGLTLEQRKLLEENKNKHREQTKTLFAQLRQKMTLLRQELEKSELDMQAIYQTNNELKQLQAQMLDNRLERILEVRKILTPEQFKKFEDKMNERMGHFKNKRERNKKEKF